MVLWVKILLLFAVVSVGFQYGLLFSRWSSGNWRGAVDTVTLIAISVSLVAFVILIVRPTP
jgi:hypothetical protein